MTEHYATTRSLAAGTVLAGRFHIKELIGTGGMGEVYRAIQLSVDREIAIKTLRQDPFMPPEARALWLERFRNEAAALSRLHHPNTVSIIDYGETADGICFLAMEYLKGVTLDEILEDKGALSTKTILHIMGRVSRSLSEAHKVGIVHRDLKPGNIFLSDFDGEQWVKVMDFGIALLGEPDENQDLTMTGTVLGSPAYMAPEQASGDRAGPHSDIYALGVILYQMLSGRQPFDGTSSTEVMVKHIHDPVPQLLASALPHSPPPGLVDLAHRCLEKRPERRPVSAGEILDLLTAIEQGAPSRLYTGLAVAAQHAMAAEPTLDLESTADIARRRSASRRLARIGPYRRIGSFLLSLLALGLLLAPVHFFAGGVVVEAVLHQASAASTAGTAVTKWATGRGVVSLLFTAEDSCRLTEEFARGLATRLEDHGEECQQFELNGLLADLASGCPGPRAARTRIDGLSARLVHLCDCENSDALQGLAKAYLDDGEGRSTVEAARVFHTIGSCAYRQVFRRDYSAPEQRSQLLLESLTWSQNALVALEKLEEESSDSIVLRLEALNNTSNALKLLNRHVEAEGRLREAIDYAKDKNNQFFRREYYRMVAPLHFNLGLLLTDYGEEEDFQEALKQLRTAERLFSLRMGKKNSAHLDKVRTQLGVLYCRFGQVAKASDLLYRSTQSRWTRFEQAPIADVDQRRGEYFSSLSHLTWALVDCALSKSLCKGGGKEGLETLRGWLNRITPGEHDEETVAGAHWTAQAAVCQILSDIDCARASFEKGMRHFAAEGTQPGTAADFTELYYRALEGSGQADSSQLLSVTALSVGYLADHIDELLLAGKRSARLVRLKDTLAGRWRRCAALCQKSQIREVCRGLESKVASCLSQ